MLINQLQIEFLWSWKMKSYLEHMVIMHMNEWWIFPKVQVWLLLGNFISWLLNTNGKNRPYLYKIFIRCNMDRLMKICQFCWDKIVTVHNFKKMKDYDITTGLWKNETTFLSNFLNYFVKKVHWSNEVSL